MKRLFLILAVLTVIFKGTVFSQAYETRSFDLPASTAHAELTAEEQKMPSVILTEARTYEYLYNSSDALTLYYTFHRRLHLNEQSEVEKFNRIYLPVSSPSDLLALKLRSVSKSGKVTEMYKGDLKQVTEDGRNYLILAVEGLEKDSELEYYFTTQRSTTYFLTDYVQLGTFIRNADIRLISPDNLIFKYKTYNGDASVEDTIISSKRFISLKMDSIPVLDPEEKYATVSANKLRVEFKLSRNKAGNNAPLFTWNDAGNRFYEIMHEEEKSARKDVAALASKLGLKKKKTQEEQIRAFENYMKVTINSTPNDDVFTIKDMLKKNYGSAGLITSLYILMFEHLEIPCELVITTSRFKAWFDPDFDTWNYLDDYFVYLPEQKKFLDPTGFLYRFGLIPNEYIDNNGLFIKKLTVGDVSSGVAKVKKIESPAFDDNYDNMDAVVDFKPGMDEVTIKMHREFAGYSDNLIRAAYFYSDESNRDDITKSLLESAGKNFKTESVNLTNYDLMKGDYTKPLVLDSKVSTPTLIEKAGDNILFTIGMVIGEQAEMYQEHERQNPIDIQFPHRYKRVITVNLPSGYDVKGLDKLNMNVVYEDKGFGFTSTYKQEGNKLIVTVSEYYNRTTWPVSDIEEFRKVINAAADFNKIKIILSKS